MNTTFKISIFAYILSVFLVSCSNNDSGSDDTAESVTLNGQNFSIVTQNVLSKDPTAISGTGVIVNGKPFLSPDAGGHWRIVGNLETSGSLSLNAFSDGNASKGIDIRFQNIDGILKVALVVNDSSVDISNHFSGRSAESIDYSLDIHNDESPAHILIWEGLPSSYEEGNTLFNSEDAESAPGNGSGSHWGVSLVDAEITQAAKVEPKFEEE